jgi:saccharopine dehydrogenase (NAD+, L-lysine-forming)
VAGVDRTSYEDVPALPISYSLQTILEEFSLEPAVYAKGKLRFVAPMSGQSLMRFPPPVGVQRPMYTIHSELATLPSSFASKGVREVSFKIAFDPAFVEKVRFIRNLGLASAEPIRIRETQVVPIQVLNQLARLQKAPRRIGKLKQYEIVRTIVKGTKGKQKLTLVMDLHTSGQPKWGIGSELNTGCPPAVVARLISSGAIQGAGVFAPEQIVPVKLFFDQLKRRGFVLKIARKSGWAMKT